MQRPFTDLAGHINVVDACSSENSGAPSLVTAASTGDATKRTGQTIDRMSGTSMANACVLSTSYLAAIGASETFSLAHELQESDDGTNWDNAEVIEALTEKAEGSGNKRGTDVHPIDLLGRKRYIRFNVTPDLSRSGTDTATFHSVAVLGGYDQVPVS